MVWASCVTSFTLDRRVVGLSEQNLSCVCKTLVFDLDYFRMFLNNFVRLIILEIKSYLFTVLFRKVNSRCVCSFWNMFHTICRLSTSHFYPVVLNIWLAINFGVAIEIILKTTDGLLAGLPGDHLVLHLHKLLVVVLNIWSIN